MHCVIFCSVFLACFSVSFFWDFISMHRSSSPFKSCIHLLTMGDHLVTKICQLQGIKAKCVCHQGTNNLNTMLRQHRVHLEERRTTPLLWFNPRIFLMGTTETLSSSREHKSFDWARTDWWADSQVLASQVAFVKSVSPLFECPTTPCSQCSL